MHKEEYEKLSKLEQLDEDRQASWEAQMDI